jgi:hypothetical protein
MISSLNDHRRHDEPTERALVGERMASLKKGGDAGVHKSNSPAGPLVPAITMARAAELAGTSPSQIKRVRKAKRDGVPELVEMLESGEITPATADTVASLPEEDQRKAVSGGVAGVKSAARKAREDSATKAEAPELEATEDSEAQEPQSKPQRAPNYIPSEGMLIWGMAKSQLVRIAKNDTHRVNALNACIAYCQERISANK